MEVREGGNKELGGGKFFRRWKEKVLEGAKIF